MTTARWRIGCVAVACLALQACIVVPARRYAVGVGGSGYYAPAHVSLEAARAACVNQARNVRGYDVLRVNEVDRVSGDLARVRLRVAGQFSPVSLDCTYDARTGFAYLP